MSITVLNSINGEVQFAYIYDGAEMLGDGALFPDGTATVVNALNNLQQWFDNPETGHDDALRYIKGRITPDPVFR